MIIVCINCDKKFEINSDLIPESGRLLKCSGCDHQWFFQKKTIPESKQQIETDKLKIFETQSLQKEKLKNKLENISNNEKISIPIVTENIINQAENILDNKKKVIKKNNTLNSIIIFIISFVALVILIDTFESPLSNIIPNIEFILYNLYESIKDIGLFFKDLI
tara:strand:- start:187 stop:678 length:492 start_codon:yes stop_codon:yes gene_type:complete